MATPHKRSVWPGALRGALRVSTLGWELAVPIAGGALLGYMLHGRYHSGPLVTVALVFLGAIVGAYNVWRQLKLELGRDGRSNQRASMEDSTP